MTDTKQPEALRALAESVAWTGRWYDAGCNTVHCTYDKEDSIEHDEIAHPVPLGVSGYIAAAHPQAVIALLDRIAELEAQLESIGAGGVSGPLMGKPQEMPDLSALTENGAKAWAGVDAQGLREGFTAADMATASAQGFRDGVASVAASAGSEPVAWLVCTEEGDPEMVFLSQHEAQQYLEDDERPTPLYLHPSPPEGMVGEWRPIETAPKDGSEVLVNATGIGLVVVYWSDDESQWGTGLGYLNGEAPTHWMPLPLPPTTAAGSEKGE